MARPRVANSAARLVEVWQSSSSPAEAAKRLGIQTRSATTRASYLRRRGVKLQRFEGGRPEPLDIEALNQIAKKAAKS